MKGYVRPVAMSNIAALIQLMHVKNFEIVSCRDSWQFIGGVIGCDSRTISWRQQHMNLMDFLLRRTPGVDDRTDEDNDVWERFGAKEIGRAHV